jgi:hypothetical protein
MVDVDSYIKEHKAWQEKYDALAPKVGDSAPDFEVRDVNGENPVHLSDLWHRHPLTLIFGSYT